MDLVIRDALDIAAFARPAIGNVYGALLNFRDALESLGGAVNAPPYKAPPRAPVLFVKPRNTWAAAGAAIAVPRGVAALAMGGTLGVVIGRVACRVQEVDARDHIAGYTIANHVSVPHESYFRPSIRENCRDRFCPIGPRIVARDRLDPDVVTIDVAIDGVSRQRACTRDLVRPVAKLIVEVSEFMTLHPGDVLLVGIAARPPLARAGQAVSVTIDGIGVLDNVLVDEDNA
jgi:5-oxopent-3-ene-1,2,5-tricarboxylate decarboxylase/2-hydroxyhepta-2,4-diene-1,7-dioate isomerase